jgi:hypothetical protein
MACHLTAEWCVQAAHCLVCLCSCCHSNRTTWDTARDTSGHLFVPGTARPQAKQALEASRAVQGTPVDTRICRGLYGPGQIRVSTGVHCTALEASNSSPTATLAPAMHGIQWHMRCTVKPVYQNPTGTQLQTVLHVHHAAGCKLHAYCASGSPLLLEVG